MSLNTTNLYIQASPLPATFRGTPNDMFTEMLQRMKIMSPSGTNFIFIGDTAPSSNVGPWLKGGTQWWVWSAATKTYVPQDISASFTPAFVAGSTPPTTYDPPFWLQTTKDPTSSNPLDFGSAVRFFVWTGSVWTSPHPVPPSSKECRIWIGNEAELWLYDGGDGTDPSTNAPTDFTGAMWQVESSFAFRFPVGAGTNTVIYDGGIANAIAPGATGGEERHTLDTTEIPAHTHPVSSDDYNVPAGASTTLRPQGVGPTAAVTGSTGGGKSHENMPPFLGVYFIRRTARKYYTP